MPGEPREIPGEPRREQFDEAAFLPYAAPGSGSITGRAAGVFDDKATRVANCATVRLLPDNAYTEEMERRTLRQTNQLSPPDPRMTRYVREVKTDRDGHFAFRGLPAGQYYVTCRFTWPYHTIVYQDADRPVDSDNIAEQTLYAKVTLTAGQSVQVDSWSISQWFAMPVR